MRKVGLFKEQNKAVDFVGHLNKSQITALIEEDAGEYAIWVHDEGHVFLAKKLYAEFQSTEVGVKISKDEVPKKVASIVKVYQPYLTKFLFTACVFVFVLASLQTYSGDGSKNGIYSFPPVAKALLIDYPRGDEIVDELINRFGEESVRKNQLPEEAAPLVEQYSQSPPWTGFYQILLEKKEKRAMLWNGQILSKVKDGELWRLFTPAILHLSLLHILFNLLWLLVLGKMVEKNMGRIRYFLFILITGVFSNLCQYAMTGPYFMGISGVLSALIGYIWMRKRIAPWEVYLVRKESISFFMIFIFAFLGLQLISFFVQKFSGYVLPIYIANTGHISGLGFGIVIAKTHFLSKKLN